MPTKILRHVLLAASFLLIALTFRLARELNAPLRFAGQPVFLEVEKGWNVRRIAGELRQAGLLERPAGFLLGYRLYFADRTLKAGEYRFAPPLGLKQGLLMMAEGLVHLAPLTIPEGLTIAEIAELLGREAPERGREFLTAAGDTSLLAGLDPEAADLEGYLFPDTYLLPRKAGGREVVAVMVEGFRKVFDEARLKRAAELRLTPRQVVTLASMIEKETGLQEERPLVASVFHNRLRLGMKLDCDPTVVYALQRHGLYRGRLLKKDLSFPSPYNTYLNPGLPPGPICNPGRDSIEAALYPARTEYLYFVSRNDGSHQFSSRYEDHLSAVRRFQLKNR
jgi:UPF0755 protein